MPPADALFIQFQWVNKSNGNSNGNNNSNHNNANFNGHYNKAITIKNEQTHTQTHTHRDYDNNNDSHLLGLWGVLIIFNCVAFTNTARPLSRTEQTN